MLAASSPFPGRLGCSRYRSGIREFWQARTSEAGALPSLHVMPIKAAYGRLPWEVPVLPFGTREPLTALAQGNLPKVLIYENRGSALNESSLIDNDAGVVEAENLC